MRDGVMDQQPASDNGRFSLMGLLKSGSDQTPQNYSYMPAAFWDMVGEDQPDSIMLRFLRARKWDVQKALSMIFETLTWRRQADVEGIMQVGEAGLSVQQMECGKAYFHGVDLEGRPIW